MQEQTKIVTQPLLRHLVKANELTEKRFIPTASLAESLRPVRSLKRRKTLKPKALIPFSRKAF